MLSKVASEGQNSCSFATFVSFQTQNDNRGWRGNAVMRVQAELLVPVSCYGTTGVKVSFWTAEAGITVCHKAIAF